MNIAGVDEAGRGPLAGPVVTAAVILDPKQIPSGLDDSKKLSEKKRGALFDEILNHALAHSIIEVSVQEIDQYNILQATLRGMAKAVARLNLKPDVVRVDGNQRPPIDGLVETLVGGDALEPAISAASILAKVHRDRYMLDLHEQFPAYGFDRHKGYPTADHIKALTMHGPCPAHRRSFKPVSLALAAHQSGQ